MAAAEDEAWERIPQRAEGSSRRRCGQPTSKTTPRAQNSLHGASIPARVRVPVRVRVPYADGQGCAYAYEYERFRRNCYDLTLTRQRAVTYVHEDGPRCATRGRHGTRHCEPARLRRRRQLASTVGGEVRHCADYLLRR